jgi:hypothetical protein
MLVKNVRVSDWEIPLGHATPLIVTTANKSRTFLSRRGSYMYIEGEAHGVGEMVEPVFTLPGEDPGTILAEARRILYACTSSLTGLVLGDDWIHDIKNAVSICCVLESHESPMSKRLACFCVEQALLTFVARSRSIPLWFILREYMGITCISVNAYDGVVRLNTMLNMRGAKDLGVLPRGVIKLKVGGGESSPAKDARRVNGVAAEIEPIKFPILRLDANQSWSAIEYREFLKSLSSHAVSLIQYIEEPFKADSVAERNHQLRDSVRSLPIALDESLLLPEIDSILKEQVDLRIINKVSLHGIASSHPMFLEGSRTTITCTFETGIGLAFLVSLAYAVNPEEYHGLHPLPQMSASSRITCEFSRLVHNDPQGSFVNVRESEALLLNFSKFR